MLPSLFPTSFNAVLAWSNRSCLFRFVSFNGSSTFSSAVSTGIRLKDDEANMLIPPPGDGRIRQRRKIFAQHIGEDKANLLGCKAIADSLAV